MPFWMMDLRLSRSMLSRLRARSPSSAFLSEGSPEGPGELWVLWVSSEALWPAPAKGAPPGGAPPNCWRGCRTLACGRIRRLGGESAFHLLSCFSLIPPPLVFVFLMGISQNCRYWHFCSGGFCKWRSLPCLKMVVVVENRGTPKYGLPGQLSANVDLYPNRPTLKRGLVVLPFVIPFLLGFPYPFGLRMEAKGETPV